MTVDKKPDIGTIAKAVVEGASLSRVKEKLEEEKPVAEISNTRKTTADAALQAITDKATKDQSEGDVSPQAEFLVVVEKYWETISGLLQKLVEKKLISSEKIEDYRRNLYGKVLEDGLEVEDNNASLVVVQDTLRRIENIINQAENQELAAVEQYYQDVFDAIFKAVREKGLSGASEDVSKIEGDLNNFIAGFNVAVQALKAYAESEVADSESFEDARTALKAMKFESTVFSGVSDNFESSLDTMFEAVKASKVAQAEAEAKATQAGTDLAEANRLKEAADTARDKERRLKESAKTALEGVVEITADLQNNRESFVNALRSLTPDQKTELKSIEADLNDPLKRKNALDRFTDLVTNNTSTGKLGDKVEPIQEAIDAVYENASNEKPKAVETLISVIQGIVTDAQKVPNGFSQEDLDKAKQEGREEAEQKMLELLKGFDPIILQMQEIIKRFNPDRWEQIKGVTALGSFELTGDDLTKAEANLAYKATKEKLADYFSPEKVAAREQQAANSNLDWYEQRVARRASVGGASHPVQRGFFNRSEVPADQFGLINIAGESGSQNPDSIRTRLHGRILRMIDGDKENDEVIAMRWLEENSRSFSPEMTELIVDAVRGNLDSLRRVNDENKVEDIEAMLREMEEQGALSREGHKHLRDALDVVRRTQESAEALADRQARASLPNSLHGLTPIPGEVNGKRVATNEMRVWGLFGNRISNSRSTIPQGAEFKILQKYSASAERVAYKVRYRGSEYLFVE